MKQNYYTIIFIIIFINIYISNGCPFLRDKNQINPSSFKPSSHPSISSTLPKKSPSAIPSRSPTKSPSSSSVSQTNKPSRSPTKLPSRSPITNLPSMTKSPTKVSSACPTISPSKILLPTTLPSRSNSPKLVPSRIPSNSPSRTLLPTRSPSKSYKPSSAPSRRPSVTPTIKSTKSPNIGVNGNHAFSFPICRKTNGLTVNYLNPNNNANLCSVYADVKSELNAQVNAYANNLFNISDLFGASLRLVFHDAVDVDMTTSDLMGSDGCIGDSLGSTGLIEPNSPVFTVLEPIYQNYCDQINRADFIVLFGKLVVELAEITNSINLPFSYGRREARDCSAGIGRSPDAQRGVDAIRETFIVRMNLTYTDAVVLLGGHTLGHVHPDNSGYNGHPGDPNTNTDITINAWDSTPTVFDNDYYFQVLNVPWANIFNSLNETDKNIWIDTNCGASFGSFNIYPSPSTVNVCNNGGKLIALNTDMALTFPVNTTNVQNPRGYNTGLYLQQCLMPDSEELRFTPIRCIGPSHPRDAIYQQVFFTETYVQKGQVFVPIPAWNDPTGNIDITYNEMVPIFRQFSTEQTFPGGDQSNLLFLKAFELSWKKMVSVGYGTIDGKGGKLGALKSFDFTTCPTTKNSK